MKTITIYTRTVIIRTRFQKWRYRSEFQYFIFEGKKEAKKIDEINKPLRVKYYKILQTRSKKELEAFKNKLGRTHDEQSLKKEINKILEENK